MIPQGSVFKLEPERFQAHADIVVRLKKLPAWKERDPVEAKPTETLPTNDDESESILPHQERVIEEIRRQNLNKTSIQDTSTE